MLFAGRVFLTLPGDELTRLVRLPSWDLNLPPVEEEFLDSLQPSSPSQLPGSSSTQLPDQVKSSPFVSKRILFSQGFYRSRKRTKYAHISDNDHNTSSPQVQRYRFLDQERKAFLDGSPSRDAEKLPSNGDSATEQDKQPMVTVMPQFNSVSQGDGLPKTPTELFSLYNWDYVKENPEKYTDRPHENTSPNHQQDLFRTLRLWTHEINSDEFFSVEKKDAIRFMTEYKALRWRCLYPAVEDHDVARVLDARSTELMYLILRMANNKLEIETYPAFKKTIAHFTQRLHSKKRVISKKKYKKTKNVSDAKIETIISYISDVNKIAPFLILISMSFFRQHDREILTSDAINNILTFMGDLWIKIANCQAPVNKRQYPWAKQNFIYYL
ncbi:hypothetical protein H4Q26_004022 [Puccinia striiformis f. sp. tritici PST-130]|nr:hypothetical protein H4Q26_004022 [Puccinia striiformis f. sp. tritici PST-130]